MTYQEKFQAIKSAYEESFDMDFYTDSLTDLIQEIRADKASNQTIIERILLDWADEVGCADDGEICEKSLDKLHQGGFLTEKELKLFWENTHFRQG